MKAFTSVIILINDTTKIGLKLILRLFAYLRIELLIALINHFTDYLTII